MSLLEQNVQGKGRVHFKLWLVASNMVVIYDLVMMK